MNIESLILVYRYFSTMERKNFVFEIFIPLVIAVVILSVSIHEDYSKLYQDFITPMQPILGVFIGFSIMVITVLTTSNSDNIIRIKRIEHSVKKNEVDSLFNILLLNFVYSIFVEIILLLLIFSLPLFYKTCKASDLTYHITFGFFFWTFIHILFLTIRSITDFYFSLRES